MWNGPLWDAGLTPETKDAGRIEKLVLDRGWSRPSGSARKP